MVVAAAAGVDEIEEEDAGPAEATFEYLLSMPIQSLTLEKVRHIHFRHVAHHILRSQYACNNKPFAT